MEPALPQSRGAKVGAWLGQALHLSRDTQAGYEPVADYDGVRRKLSNRTWVCECGGTYISALNRVGFRELALDSVLLQSHDECTECLA